MERTRIGEIFPGKYGEKVGAGEEREQEPVFVAEASQSHRLELLVICKLTTPGLRAAPTPPAAAIIV